MKRRERRSPAYLLTGLLIGLGIGLLVSLLILPTRYTDTTPDSLAPQYKDAYRILIARAYLADNDLGRAWARLSLLRDASPRDVLNEQARLLAMDSTTLPDARALARLAAALGQPQPAMQTLLPQATPSLPVGSPQPTLDQTQAVRSPTPLPTATPLLSPTPTRTPTVTPTPRSSPTPTATLGTPFQLKDSQPACDLNAPNWDTLSLIEINVLDAAGNPVPGVRVIVSWEGGQDLFYTGLYPEIGPGYADFTMQPDTTYSVQVGEGGEVATDISAPNCADANNVPYWGRWRVTFQQP